MTEEIWKAVPGYEGKYEASTLGHVRVTKTGAEVKPATQKVIVRLELDGNRNELPLSRVIAMTFLPNPLMYKEVQVADGNIKNNAVTNLLWVGKIDDKKYKKLNDSITVVDENANGLFVIYSSKALAQRVGVSVEFLKIHYLAMVSMGVYNKTIHANNYVMQLKDFNKLMLEGSAVYRKQKKTFEDMVDKIDNISGSTEPVKGKHNVEAILNELSEDELNLIKFDMRDITHLPPRKFNPKYHLVKSYVVKLIPQEDIDKLMEELAESLNKSCQSLIEVADKYKEKQELLEARWKENLSHTY